MLWHDVTFDMLQKCYSIVSFNWLVIVFSSLLRIKSNTNLIPIDIHDTPHISGIISKSCLADQSSYSHLDQCVTKTITESADKQDIVMDPNSSTPMEGSTRVGDIAAHISDQDSDSCSEVTSDCSIDSVNVDQTWVYLCSDTSLWDQWTDNAHIVVPTRENLPNHHGMY